MPLALRRISKVLGFRELFENFRGIFEDFEKLKVCDFH